jgi:photosystem II stability/assembly factor-like uncharacterized protein
MLTIKPNSKIQLATLILYLTISVSLLQGCETMPTSFDVLNGVISKNPNPSNSQTSNPQPTSISTDTKPQTTRTEIIKVFSAPNEWGSGTNPIQEIKSDSYGNIYALSYLGKIYKSLDNGNKWKELPIKEKIISIGIDNKNVLFARGNAGHWLFKSIDSGESWTESSIGIPKSTLPNIEHPAFAFDKKSSSIYTTADGKNRLNTNALYKSVDGGKKWTVARQGSESTIRSIAVDHEGNVIALASRSSSEHKIFKANSSQQIWTNIAPRGYEPATSNDIAINKNGDIYVMESNGLIMGPKNSNEWKVVFKNQVRSVPPSSVYIDENDNIYVGFQGGIAKSSNSGTSWKTIYNTGLQSESIKAIAIGKNGDIFAGDASGAIYRLTNGANL